MPYKLFSYMVSHVSITGAISIFSYQNINKLGVVQDFCTVLQLLRLVYILISELSSSHISSSNYLLQYCYFISAFHWVWKTSYGGDFPETIPGIFYLKEIYLVFLLTHFYVSKLFECVSPLYNTRIIISFLVNDFPGSRLEFSIWVSLWTGRRHEVPREET